MNILHISIECYPIAKVGGLADVVGALPKYQKDLGNDVLVITPFHDNQFTKDATLQEVYSGTIVVGNDEHRYTIHNLVSLDLGFTVNLVHIPGLLDREQVYGHKDEIERFVAFQIAVLDWIKDKQYIPDVIHCHDHHTGLIPFMISHANAYYYIRDIPTVFTIHNAQYQGQIPYDRLNYLPDFDHSKIGLLDWDNQINPLATGIKNSWRVTTVSPTYMKELQRRANGLEGLLRDEKKKCIGILNGIDTVTWDPETDPMLIKNYGVGSVISGRKANKKWICESFGLSLDKPLFGFIGRLVSEKGADLLPDIIEESLNTTDVNIFILGSGSPETENRLRALKEKFPDRYHAHIGYDEKLSHIVYAGADFLLMPSRVEPCGLNQMYALRYGSVPIVRRTGGLKDTIIDIGEGGFGICHDQVLVWDVCYSIKRAIGLYEDEKMYKKLQRQIMKIDHSWNRSAQEYTNLYITLINN